MNNIINNNFNNNEEINLFLNSITNEYNNQLNHNQINNNNNNYNNNIEKNINILNKIEFLSIIENNFDDDSVVPNNKFTPPTTPTKLNNFNNNEVFESPKRNQSIDPICPGAPKKKHGYLQPKSSFGNCKRRILFPELNQELNSSNEISLLSSSPSSSPSSSLSSSSSTTSNTPSSPKVSKSSSQIQFIPSSSFKNIDSTIARKRLLF